MSTFKSRGLRGSTFEEFINKTNELYAENNLALIQKIPTPITPIDMDGRGHITLAYEQYREYLFALMPRNAIKILFHYKMFILIKWNL